MRFGPAQAQEITTVAGDDNQSLAYSVAQGCEIVGGAGQHLLKNLDLVASAGTSRRLKSEICLQRFKGNTPPDKTAASGCRH